MKLLETTECISIINNGRKYTDCMEFSLLRFLHILCYNMNELTDADSCQFGLENPISQSSIDEELKGFITKHPKICPQAEYYLDNEEGIQERENWAIFVSDRPFFEYYRNDSAELFTNLHNIFQFYKHFFQLPLETLLSRDLNDRANREIIHKNLKLMSSAFSTNGKKIDIKIASYYEHVYTSPLKKVAAYVSRPDEEYKNSPYYSSPESLIYKHCNTVINISINAELCYEWNLTEVYFSQPNIFVNPLITGHSVIYMKEKEDTEEF